MSDDRAAREALAQRILAEARERASTAPNPGANALILLTAERKAASALAGVFVDWAPPKPKAPTESRRVGRPRAAQVGRDLIDVDGKRRQTQRRACLRCRRSFDSAGPGNRMCDPCRARSADASPYAV